MTSLIEVAEYYAGKSIFITGATGFMGIVLVEKLLRSCPDLKTLYLLMRPKKGFSSEERLKNYINNEVFEKIRTDGSNSLYKLQIIAGDVEDDHLGISVDDQKELQRECQIIFHCAASVRFDMFIRDAVNINVNGTLKVLQFAEAMKNLEVFVYTSTAYCHDYLDVLEEKLYPSKHTPQDIMNLVKWMDDDMLKKIENKLIHPFPNTYTYTKELSEDLVSQFAGKFPIAITRPSIVTVAWREPMPGWINNMNGPIGVIVAIARGVLHVLHTRKNLKPDVLPVDIAINASIIFACTIGLEKPKDIRVCNITNSALHTMSWVESCKMARSFILKYPFAGCVWYPSVAYYESKLLYLIHMLFVQWLPALMIDGLLFLLRIKPFMMKIQKRLFHGLNLLSHYSNKDWIFRNNCFLSLRDRLKAEERDIFFIEYEKICSKVYVSNLVQGARKYLCKDPLSTLPRAKRLLKMLFCLHVIVQIVLLWWFINFVYHFVKKLV